ncbi:MAG TPA: NAD(P)-dependent oxidoreductase [Solirubrobacteraceae bacterium]
MGREAHIAASLGGYVPYMQTIGLVGAGRMGLPVCERLVRAGFVVVASDRDPERRAVVEAVGAGWAETARSAADAAEVLITVLPGSPELQAVMSTLLPAMPPGRSWIDLTSTSPQIGAKLRALASHLECLDAPMGGGPDAARAGTLELFVGGDLETVERHREVLEALGTLHYLGGPGAGHVVKLLVNLLWFGQALATAEALLIARRAELDLDAVRHALASSAADSRFIRRDLAAMLDGDYMTDFGLDRCCEELNAIAELAHGLEVPFELSALVSDIYARALERYGPRKGELLAVAMLEETAGVTLGRRTARPA